MGMHGGVGTTLEDDVIWGEPAGPLIDKATDELMTLTVGWETDHERHEVRTILERLVWVLAKEWGVE